MTKHMCRWFLLAILSASFAQLGVAEERFILRVPPALLDQLVAKYGLNVVKPLDSHGFAVVSAADSKIKDAIKDELEIDPDDKGIESDNSVPVPELKRNARLSPPADPILAALAARTPVSFYGAKAWNSYVNQPAGGSIYLKEAQHEYATGSGIIAIIDTGVDPGHPVLKASLVEGYDFTRDIAGMASELGDLDQSTAVILDQSTAAILDKDSVVMINQSTAAILDQSTAVILDKNLLPSAFGHGTMIAGIVHLVAPTAKIMPLKAFNADGTASTSNIVRAIYYAVDSGASVINMSFSLDQPSVELAKAVNYAAARGVICVASAGNGGQESLVFPAAFRGVLGVAAVGDAGLRSPFSNYGSAVALLAAPGEGIVTTYPGANYAVVSGTSFAAAFISGGGNLMQHVHHDLTVQEIIQALSNKKKAAVDLGYGRVDFYRVLKALKEMPD